MDNTVQITVSNPYTALQKKLAKVVGSEEAHLIAHETLGRFCNRYVPHKTGELRRSMEVTPDYVSWDTPYARYQYEGDVYGPNVPIIQNDIIVGWYTPEGSSRYFTGRELGVPGNYKGWVFGYSQPGTGHHWFEKAMAGGGKRRFSLQFTNALKRHVRELDL